MMVRGVRTKQCHGSCHALTFALLNACVEQAPSTKHLLCTTIENCMRCSLSFSKLSLITDIAIVNMPFFQRRSSLVKPTGELITSFFLFGRVGVSWSWSCSCCGTTARRWAMWGRRAWGGSRLLGWSGLSLFLLTVWRGVCFFRRVEWWCSRIMSVMINVIPVFRFLVGEVDGARRVERCCCWAFCDVRSS